MRRRLRLLSGFFVTGLSLVAVGIGLSRGRLGGVDVVVLAFFACTAWLGLAVVRGSWKNEREHEAKLTRLLDEVRAQEAAGATDAQGAQGAAAESEPAARRADARQEIGQ